MGENDNLTFEEAYEALLDRQADEISQVSNPMHMRMHGVTKEELEETLAELAVEHAKQKKETCGKYGKKVPE